MTGGDGLARTSFFVTLSGSEGSGNDTHLLSLRGAIATKQSLITWNKLHNLVVAQFIGQPDESGNYKDFTLTLS